ncbi:MAG TPA: GNAT family N-acetyltransferase [Myxococcales bacterium]
MIRILGPGDEATLEAFLAPRANTSMFLRANARQGGLDDRGQPRQATYAAAIGPSGVVAVAAHCWNGILLLQAPERVPEVARAALAASGRPLKGISGPVDQVRTARDALEVRKAAVDDADLLYSLDLAGLRVPAALAALSLRRPRGDDLPRLIAWREQYLVETGLSAPGPTLHQDARSSIELQQAQGDHWLLEDRGVPVAYTAFNARLPDIVQVGGVWTPPPLRGRGYARCAVAGSLLEARAAGARRAILFTSNTSAARAYEALGLTRSGEYGLLIL